MTKDPDSVIVLKLSNSARMVINAISSETGPLTDDELFLAGCHLAETLAAVPNILEVGDKKIDIPRALHATQSLGPDDPQRIGVEQMAAQWRRLPCELTLGSRQLAVLRLQLEHILTNQGQRQTVVQLTLSPNCAEAVAVLTGRSGEVSEPVKG